MCSDFDRVVGFDPGLKGGVCSLDRDGRIIRIEPMPVTGRKATTGMALRLRELVGWLEGARVLAVIEAQQAYPGQGVSSSFATGASFGALVGLAIACRCAVLIAKPREWQAAVGSTDAIGPDPKARALATARSLFPGRSWLASDRSSVPHDGMVDAALIATYGLNRSREGIV